MSIRPRVKEVLARARLLAEETKTGCYCNLNPDERFMLGLVEALMVNEERCGYPSCPYRLASGDREEDPDIVCPLDHRNPDLVGLQGEKGAVRAVHAVLSSVCLLEK